jgi:dTDP-glucose 4,6-dehydratase
MEIRPHRASPPGTMSLNSIIIVTGGAGFIGSNFVRLWLRSEKDAVVNLDKLTYAGNTANLADISDDPRHVFVRGDICDDELVSSLIKRHRPRAIVHFAAESHVDRSIHSPQAFLQTNVMGTFCLLDRARDYWEKLAPEQQEQFRFLHVSTDEVYGSLQPDAAPTTETSPYAPNSPYSASKAASNHMVRAFFRTYGLPTLTTNGSNVYGPYQHPEKFLPLMLVNALSGKSLPVYGDGKQVRDWLYVEDHCAAIRTVLRAGRPGETYNVGGKSERMNLDVAKALCTMLDELVPDSRWRPHASLIALVQDRPGHDRRYAMDVQKIERTMGWHPVETFESGLRKTLEWYLANREWMQSVVGADFQRWTKENYGTRGAK